jgi:hypothetical protein
MFITPIKEPGTEGKELPMGAQNPTTWIGIGLLSLPLYVPVEASGQGKEVLRHGSR